MSDRQKLQGRRVALSDRLVVSTTEAAELMGVSRDTFRDEIAPDVRAVVIGRRRHWPVVELERWVALHLERSIQD